MDERRSKTRDAMRASVSALCVDLLAVRAGDRDAPHLRPMVDALAVEARGADVPPERLLIVLKRLINGDELAHLGLVDRLRIRERFVQWTIASYYRSDD